MNLSELPADFWVSWYYIHDGKRYGPFSVEEMETLVQNGMVQRDMMVWANGEKEWLKAELFERFHFGPPAFRADSYEKRLQVEGLNDLKQDAVLPIGERLVACIIDAVITNVLGGVFVLIRAIADPMHPTSQSEAVFWGALITWLYYTLLESSERRATWGQQVMGIQVVTVNFNKMTFLQAGWRRLLFVLSSLNFNGALLVLSGLMILTPLRRGLHDYLSGSKVVLGAKQKQSLTSLAEVQVEKEMELV